MKKRLKKKMMQRRKLMKKITSEKKTTIFYLEFEKYIDLYLDFLIRIFFFILGFFLKERKTLFILKKARLGGTRSHRLS